VQQQAAHYSTTRHTTHLGVLLIQLLKRCLVTRPGSSTTATATSSLAAALLASGSSSVAVAGWAALPAASRLLLLACCIALCSSILACSLFYSGSKSHGSARDHNTQNKGCSASSRMPSSGRPP
jgi:hypothetical protein